MICKHCGTEIPDDSLFCFNCGQKVEKEENVTPVDVTPQDNGPVERSGFISSPEEFEQKIEELSNKAEEQAAVIEEKVQTAFNEAEKREQEEMLHGSKANTATGTASIDENTAGSALLIFASVFGIFFAGRTLVKAWYFLRGLFSLIGQLGWFMYEPFFYIRYFLSALVGGVLRIAAPLLLAVTFLLFAFRRKKTQTSEMLLGICLAAVATLPIHLVSSLLFGGSLSNGLLYDTGLGLLGAVLLFVVLYAAGYKTLLEMDTSTAVADALNAELEALTGQARDLQAKAAAKKAQQPQGSYNANSNAGAYNGAPAGSYNANVNAAPVNMVNPGAYNTGVAPASVGTQMLPTDRGIIKYFLFSILTCGIYSFFFIHGLARDVNEICKDDNDKVGGLMAYILLSILTCGLYSIYWEYKIANKLQQAAPRYNMYFSENGTSILLWTLVGILLCGIGPLIAMNIIIKNTNALAAAYNNLVLRNRSQQQ